MIVYFSGTGNSRHAALRLAELLKDGQTLDAGQCIREGEALTAHSDAPYVFVCPTYAWRIPRVFEKLLRGAAFTGNDRVYFVMTCGDGIGGAQRYLQALCAEKNWRFMGVAQIVMPENYIAMFSVPTREEAKGIVRRADQALAETAACIVAGEKLPDRPGGAAGAALSAITPWFYRFCVKAKAFYATDACCGCGACEKACMMRNICLEAGKPVWGDACTHCMACICGCPRQAIEYGKKSVGKPRYLCPEE